jgi:hypothetical protein
LLVKAADERLGLTAALADCLEDARQADRVDHTLHDLLRQRIYGLALGYEDANDAARIGDDPMHKLLLDRDPLSGASLASQPTLSRFENGVDRRGLFALSDRLADVVLDRLKARRRSQPPRLVTIDLDPTCDPTHGRQQLTFFHGHYDTYCYLPVLGFVTLDDEPESFLVAAVLRSGRAPDKQGAIGILRRLIAKVRQRFPRTRIRVRLDGGFMSWEVLAFLDQAGVEYVVGYANNKRLAQDCADLAEWAQQRYEACGHPVQVFGELEYSAKPWKGKTRRLIVKAEVVEGGSPRSTCASWSPICGGTDPPTSTRSTASAATSRTASRRSRRAWPWTGRAAPTSGPTSCASSWRRPPSRSCRSCARGFGAPVLPGHRSTGCGSVCCVSGRASSAPCVGSSCTWPLHIPGSHHGPKRRWRSVPPAADDSHHSPATR